MRAGFAFIFADRPDVEHLWFVVVVKDGTAVIANFTSWRLGYDESCVVEAGEHPFLRKRSIVLYSAARVVPICNLEAALKKKKDAASSTPAQQNFYSKFSVGRFPAHKLR